jgi:hypothetical protein
MRAKIYRRHQWPKCGNPFGYEWREIGTDYERRLRNSPQTGRGRVASDFAKVDTHEDGANSALWPWKQL